MLPRVMRHIAVEVPRQARILAATRRADVEGGCRDFRRSVERALETLKQPVECGGFDAELGAGAQWGGQRQALVVAGEQ